MSTPTTIPANQTAAALTDGGPLEILTMGCRLNAYESQVIQAHAAPAGLTNAVIVNTCAVTGEAVRQATQTIRRLRRERPDAQIIVTGCAAQLQPERFSDLSEVDHVIGNAEKMQAGTFEMLASLRRNRVPPIPEPDPQHETKPSSDHARTLVSDIMQVRQTARHLLDGFGGRARATVEVQNGCDHRCTFCIIPFARGPSRSVPIDAIIDRVRHHTTQGYNEVVLTGVDMTSYGGDLPGRPTLGDLVTRILADVPELPRLRLSSIDQIEADEALVEAIANEPRLMPHLHLSLQSGDDMVLKRMKRRHERADAVAFCDRIRRLRPDIVFGADIIAGFPTESDAMFQNSLALIEDCGLTYVHAFPFSPRPGTPAARMPQVGRKAAKQRAALLREAGQRALLSHLLSQVGQTARILVEASNMGRTPQFAEVCLDQTDRPALPHGSLHQVRITGVTAGHKLMGVPV